jgi:hypothetical protein
MIHPYPPGEEWEFPPELTCICPSDSRFDEARKILIEKYKYIPSPLEDVSTSRSLVLPRPGIDLAERLKSDDPDIRYHWGIGRVLFKHYHGKPAFHFKYFSGDCPWELIKDDPMKPALIEMVGFLNATEFFNYRGRKIDFPYDLNTTS